MIARVLMDNLAGEGFICEWGLALYIEYEGKKILLDSGTTGSFAENAEKMGIDLSMVELGVLSHAHYDHANGFERFFEVNDRAKIYIAEAVRENCYGWKAGERPHYNGVRRGMLKAHADRFVRAAGKQEIMPGVWLLGHSTPGLEGMGRKNRLYRRRGFWLRADDFQHEQSLIFETDEGLVLFNSCCHAGPDVIIRETEAAFPGRRVRAMIGGFHLFRSSDEDVRALAGRLRKCGVERLVTGHCTGDRAYALLHEELGEGVQQMYAGMVIEI